MVAHEIILSVQRLVKKYGKDLTNSAWDLILDILETILKQIEVPYDSLFIFKTTPKANLHFWDWSERKTHFRADLHKTIPEVGTKKIHAQLS